MGSSPSLSTTHRFSVAASTTGSNPVSGSSSLSTDAKFASLAQAGQSPRMVSEEIVVRVDGEAPLGEEKMKVSELIRRLEEAREWAGGKDLDVVVGETSGVLVGKIDVNVDSMGKYDNERWDDYVCIVQGYARLS